MMDTPPPATDRLNFHPWHLVPAHIANGCIA